MRSVAEAAVISDPIRNPQFRRRWRPPDKRKGGPGGTAFGSHEQGGDYTARAAPVNSHDPAVQGGRGMTATDLAEALDAVKIVPRHHKIGRQRLGCPRCDKGARDDALVLWINSDADCNWSCHRCQWSSGWRAAIVTEISAPISRQSDQRVRQDLQNHRSSLSDYACRLLSGAAPIVADDLAGRYLTARCCALPRNDMLFHPSIWHPQERCAFPAMVAVITDIITGDRISLHFTFLDPGGSGKAPIDRPRLYLAGHRKAGGVVRLTPDDETTHGVILGEGLETCLSYALEYSGIWACLDAGNLGAFPVLPGIEGVTVLIDNDDAGRRAFDAVRDRYRSAGFRHPLDIIGIEVGGKAGADVNDLVAA